MKDAELIELIVNTWISNGGDVFDFIWLSGKITERIREKEQKKATRGAIGTDKVDGQWK